MAAMGEPAEPNDDERADTRHFATTLIEAVTNDEAWPFPFDDNLTPVRARTVVFHLSQEVVKLYRELSELRAKQPNLVKEWLDRG